MPKKINPLGLNPLQLKTLALLQELAQLPDHGTAESDGTVTVRYLPHPHGDHFHVGHHVVNGRDASGLTNRSVWAALDRKGLARPLDFPSAIVLTKAGRDYDTGDIGRAVLHSHSH